MPTAAETADTLLTLRWVLAQSLREMTGNYDERESEAIAARLVESLQHKYGGGDLYIPAVPRQHLYAQVRQSFNGNNRDEICQRLQIKKSTFYRALRNGKKTA